MKGLSNNQHVKFTQLTEHLKKLQSQLDDDINEYNDIVNNARNNLGRLTDKYNDAAEEVRDFIRGVYAEMEKYYNAQPESWQEGMDGEAYAKWMESWADTEDNVNDYEPPSVNEADDLETADCDNNIDALEELETEIDIP